MVLCWGDVAAFAPKAYVQYKAFDRSVCFSVKMAFIYIDLKNFSGHSSRFSGELRFKTLFFSAFPKSHCIFGGV